VTWPCRAYTACVSFDRIAETDAAILTMVERLQQRLQAACDPRERSEIARQLQEQQLRLDLVRDQRRTRK